MSKKRNITLSLVIAVGVVTWYFFTPNQKIGEGTFSLHYHGYACGDCSLQYEIEKVESANPELVSLVGKLVHVKFSSEMENQIRIQADKCAICFNYILLGSCYQGRNGEVEIRAKHMTLEESFAGCCTD